MASTVFANGNAVATTTSGHVAHNTEPDFRIPPGQSPPGIGLPNYIQSTYLTRSLPVFTEFDSGKIWVEPSECGEPPPSMPADTFPGAHNGGKVNSFAKAQAGAGSPNVFVEGDKVERFQDKTLQNAGNSQGLIDDQAGFEKWLAEFEPVVPKAPAKAAPAGGDAATGANRPQEPAEPEPASLPPPEPEPEPPPGEDPCIFKAAVIQDEQGRTNEGGYQKRTGALLEVVPGAASGETITLSSGYDGPCPTGDHPYWEIGGAHNEKIMGATGEFKVSRIPIPDGAKAVMPLLVLLDFVPKKYMVSAVSHQSTFTRVVHAYPTGSYQAAASFEAFKSAADKVKGFLGRFVPGGVDVEVLKGELRVSAGWEELKNHLAHCPMRLQGNFFPLIGLKYEKRFSLLPLVGLIPALGFFVTGLRLANALVETLTGKKLADLYVLMRFRLMGNLSVAVDWSRTNGWGGSLNVTIAFRFELGVGLQVAMDYIKAELYVRAEARIVPTPVFRPRLGLKVKGEMPPLQGIAEVKTTFNRWWIKDISVRKQIALTSSTYVFWPEHYYDLDPRS